MERLTRIRAGIFLTIFAAIFIFFGLKLYSLQIIETDGNTDNTKTYTTITRVKAARGDIRDRNGNLLVTNRASYDLVINHYVLLSSGKANDYLLELVNLCREREIEYNDHLPISQLPFTYTTEKFNSTWQNHFQAFLKSRNLDSDITATLLLQKLRTRYSIPSTWSDEDARAVIGLRYELDLRQGSVTNLSNFVFKEDVQSVDLSAILELNIPGLNTEASTVREYATSYAAHILGYVGPMTSEQWEKYQDKGYSMDALVGQTGLEEAFEEHLHGTDGWRVDVVTPDGTILKQYYNEGQEPKAGQNVELTIDINLQIAAENSMAALYERLRGQEEDVAGFDVQGGAVVVMDVKTGQVLVCSSYPTYDLSSFFEDYEDNLVADYQPLYNRALLATYPPGSVYKMTMVTAAINNEYINPFVQIEDKGVFNKYDGFSANCLAWTMHKVVHEEVDAMFALACSCNYFFYELGDRMDWDLVDEVAKGLGLGEHTGIELNENIGYRANAETKKKLHTGTDSYWYPADAVLSAIGQGDNQFTPMQLCVYLSTLINKGVRYNATFLNRVVSQDYSQVLLEQKPVIASTMEITSDAYFAYTEGMRDAVTVPGHGTANQMFGNYGITVAAKTGTAQTGQKGSDNGAFLCYAPFEAPEIAIACYGEKVGGGSYLGEVAMNILNTYFYNQEQSTDIYVGENRLS